MKNARGRRAITLMSVPPRRSDERQQSIAVLPTPMISTRSPILSMWPKATDSSQSIPMWMRSRLVAPGNVEVLASRRAGADEHGVEVLLEQAAEARHRRVQPEVDAHVDDGRDLLVEHLGREAEGRDVGPHQPAGLVVLLEDHHVVAERHEVVGDRQRGRARRRRSTTRRPFFAVGMIGRRSAISPRRSEATRLRRQIATGAPSIRVRAACRLAGTVAGPPEDPREHVGLPVGHVGVRVPPLSDQPDVLGDVRVGRTGPLAVDDPMEIVRVRRVGWIHLMGLDSWTWTVFLTW